MFLVSSYPESLLLTIWYIVIWIQQVAERQGKYLAALLNKIGKAGAGHANSAKEIEFGDPFVYRHLGSMASIGRYKALVDLRQNKVIFIIPEILLVLQKHSVIHLPCSYRRQKGWLWQDFWVFLFGARHTSRVLSAGGTDSMYLSTGLQLWYLAVI